METIAAAADKNQHNNTLRLGQRAHEILRWKTELERAIEEMILEIDLLEEQRRRARQSKTALGESTNTVISVHILKFRKGHCRADIHYEVYILYPNRFGF